METSDDEILVEKFQFFSVLETYLSERKVFALAVCVCVCVTGLLVRHSVVHRSKYFNSRTKTFRSVAIFFRTFAKKFGFPLKILVQAVHKK